MIRLKNRYEQIVAEKGGYSEWIEPIRIAYRMACCDCGLVHLIDFRSRNGHVQFRVKRNNRATAAIRREMKKRNDQHD